MDECCLTTHRYNLGHSVSQRSDLRVHVYIMKTKGPRTKPLSIFNYNERKIYSIEVLYVINWQYLLTWRHEYCGQLYQLCFLLWPFMHAVYPDPLWVLQDKYLLKEKGSAVSLSLAKNPEFEVGITYMCSRKTPIDNDWILFWGIRVINRF